MTDTWYTSDLHIGHKLVAGLRGFDVINNGVKSPWPEAHDAFIADYWDATVKPSDAIFILGDISINGGQHVLDWIEKRPGHKHLITGNHDPVGPWERQSHKKMKHWMEYFDSIQPYLRRRLGGVEIMLSHFPYESYGDGPERPGSRYNEYRLPDVGKLLLYGHTHGKERDHDNMFHVGWDAWNSFVPQDTILQWVKSKKEIK